jgi:hypothetical protein
MVSAMSLVAALLGGNPGRHQLQFTSATTRAAINTSPGSGANIGASPSKYHWRLPGPRGWHANPLFIAATVAVIPVWLICLRWRFLRLLFSRDAHQRPRPLARHPSSSKSHSRRKDDHV